jgi:hypothetical protein
MDLNSRRTCGQLPAPVEFIGYCKLSFRDDMEVRQTLRIMHKHRSHVSRKFIRCSNANDMLQSHGDMIVMAPTDKQTDVRDDFTRSRDSHYVILRLIHCQHRF